MRRSFSFWAIGTAAILLLSGRFASPLPVEAAKNPAAEPPAKADLVQNGTHFLVRLNQEMNTGKDKVSQKFEATTVEPLETSKGHVIPPGAKIFGHISRIQAAGMAGRARLWLTFDEIETRRGTLPIVAEVFSVPGEYSVQQGETKEGEIEGHANNTTQVAESTAGAAAMGAAPGVAAHNAKTAAMGAATRGVAAFLASSGLGQELDLPEGTKLELVLDRPLYLTP